MVASCSPYGEHHVAVCGGKEVKIIDMAKSDGETLHEVWSWCIEDPTEGLPAEYAEYLNPLDECKFVDGNSKLLLTSSTSAVVLIDLKTKKNLFYARVPMAHSADLLPGDRVAVALSTHKLGNSLEIYDIAQPEKVLWRDSRVTARCGTPSARAFMRWAMMFCVSTSSRIGRAIPPRLN